MLGERHVVIAAGVDQIEDVAEGAVSRGFPAPLRSCCRSVQSCMDQVATSLALGDTPVEETLLSVIPGGSALRTREHRAHQRSVEARASW
jgi:hypothetical protein